MYIYCNECIHLVLYNGRRWYRPGDVSGLKEIPNDFRQAVLRSNDFSAGRIEVPINELRAGDQGFPKVKFHWSNNPVWVRCATDEAELGRGWTTDPSTFDPYQGRPPERTEGQEPTKWVNHWSIPGLTAEHRKSLRAILLRADAAFERSTNKEVGALAAMREAFGGIAQVLFDGGILNEQVLERLQQFVWESAIAGGWWYRSSERDLDIFTEHIGRYWIYREHDKEAQRLFRPEITEWKAALLDTPTLTSAGERRFKRAGDTWDLTFDGEQFLVRDTNGMAYIHLLLQSPGRQIDALELTHAIGRSLRGKQLSPDELAALSLRQDSGEVVLTQETQDRYRSAMKELDREIAQAESNNDLGRLETLRSEKDALMEQLRRDAGIGGRSRRFANDSDRARKAVSRAIGTALANIGKKSLRTQEYLDRQIDRGTSLSYRSDGIDWAF